MCATMRCATARRRRWTALAQGRRADPASYYFRGATFFETSAARYAWLGKTIVVCNGEREPAGVKIKFFQVL